MALTFHEMRLKTNDMRWNTTPLKPPLMRRQKHESGPAALAPVVAVPVALAPVEVVPVAWTPRPSSWQPLPHAGAAVAAAAASWAACPGPIPAYLVAALVPGRVSSARLAAGPRGVSSS